MVVAPRSGVEFNASKHSIKKRDKNWADIPDRFVDNAEEKE